MKKYFILFATVLLSVTAMAQNDVDAFRFSQVNWSGTARFMGAGGAFGSIGGDFSALATNPAAIGLYKKDEITFTPVVINAIGSKSIYNDEEVPASRVRYSLTNFGSVFSWRLNADPENPTTKWRMMQFGFGYNRINDFNNLTSATGMSNGSSWTNNVLNNANGINYNNLTHDGLAAWNTWLLDTLPGSHDEYVSYLSGSNLRQEHYCITKGGIDEMSFSLGGNYNDQVFLGLTVGVPFLDYQSETEYKEVDENDEIGGFESFNTYENLRTTGVGINAKLGVIYRPVEFFRFGVAIHTPTYYSNLKENYKREITSNFLDENNAIKQYEDEYENVSRYKLSTPLRVMGSVGFTIAKRAFISAEYEFAEYSMANLLSSENVMYRYNFKDENAAIKEKYGACHTVRVGAELAVTNCFLIRTGYAYSSSPFKNNINTGDSHNICAGIGFHGKVFFCDLAYVCRIARENSWFYSDVALNPVEICNVNHKFAATFGVKF